MANHSLEAELSAMQEIAVALHRLDPPTRARVLHWIVERFQADASFIVSGGQTSIPSSLPGGQPAASSAASPAAFEGRDETLAVDALNDLFEPHAPAPAAAVAPAAPTTQSITGMLQELVAEFQDLAREWNDTEGRPADGTAAATLVSIVPAASQA